MKTINELKISPTFCIAAYTGLYIDMTNFISPCCVYRPDWRNLDKFDSSKSIHDNYNQSAIKDLRKNLSEGIKDPRCNQCWNFENVWVLHEYRSFVVLICLTHLLFQNMLTT